MYRNLCTIISECIVSDVKSFYCDAEPVVKVGEITLFVLPNKISSGVVCTISM